MLPFGAHLVGANTTHFRLWAPSREAVQLEIVDGATLDMTPADGGWFELDAPCGAGTLYRYRFDADLAVPDPASRFQPEDVHGPSAVIDPRAYEWRNTNWHGRPWEETVLYELHVGALSASGSGSKGYRGVQEQLPALAELGITAIELMPLNDFAGARNWGYDGVLPFAPDSAYGTPEELKALIDAAHGLQMMVFLDVVYNHFGPDGNYLHAYADAFFKKDQHTPWGPAIDFERPEVRDFFFDNALYWLLEYRFDGLRFDAVHAIGDNAWLHELSERVRGAVEENRHVHLVLENEHNSSSLLEQDFNAQWSDDGHNTLHVLLTGETESYYGAYAEEPIRKLATVLGEGFVYQGQPSPIHEGKPRGEPSAHLPPTAFVLFLQNHDQIGNRAFGERLTRLADPAALRAATGLLLLSPQIPMLFMGDEWGSREPFLFFTGYVGELAEAVREGRRKEFAKFSAFNDPARRADIPDPNHERTYLASDPRGSRLSADDESGAGGAGAAASTESKGAGRQPAQVGGELLADQHDWLAFYRRALGLRHRLIVPRLAGARALGATVLSGADGADAPALIARWCLGDGSTLTCALNLGKQIVALGDRPAGELIFVTPDHAPGELTAGNLPSFSFAAWLGRP